MSLIYAQLNDTRTIVAVWERFEPTDDPYWVKAQANWLSGGHVSVEGLYSPPVYIPSVEDVDKERDRRMRLPFEFEGVLYDADDLSQSRIEKARLSALAAVAAGAQAGDVEWPGVGMPFGWIAVDNVKRPMDAQTTVRFGSVPVAREGLLIMAARAIKDRILAGEIINDVTENSLWQIPT